MSPSLALAPAHISQIGDKLQAKALARAAHVSLVPGHESEVKTNDEVMAAGASLDCQDRLTRYYFPSHLVFGGGFRLLSLWLRTVGREAAMLTTALLVCSSQDRLYC